MPYPRTPTADELAGLQCAASEYHDAQLTAAQPAEGGVAAPAPLDPAQYWDVVVGTAKDGGDTRPDVEIFDAAVLSYQSQYDVGLGSAGVAKLLLDKAQADQAAAAELAAQQLKDAYVAEARAKGAMK